MDANAAASARPSWAHSSWERRARKYSWNCAKAAREPSLSFKRRAVVRRGRGWGRGRAHDVCSLESSSCVPCVPSRRCLGSGIMSDKGMRRGCRDEWMAWRVKRRFVAACLFDFESGWPLARTPKTCATKLCSHVGEHRAAFAVYGYLHDWIREHQQPHYASATT